MVTHEWDILEHNRLPYVYCFGKSYSNALGDWFNQVLENASFVVWVSSFVYFDIEEDFP